MIRVRDLVDAIERRVPIALAEDWDNVGLLIGDPEVEVRRVMTCLTATLDVCDEAIEKRADLVISHHPLPFRGVKRVTTDDGDGQRLWRLARASISLYSAHTAFDSAAEGINQRLAEKLGGREIECLRPHPEVPYLGAGRSAQLGEPVRLDELAQRVNTILGTRGLHLVGDPEKAVKRFGVACGSAGEFLDDAIALQCDAFLTGEMSFHRALEARSRGIGVLLPGHFASERFAMEELASTWFGDFERIEVWASEREEDPLSWIDIREDRLDGVNG